MTIGILTFCLVSVLVVSFAVGDSYDKPPLADCKYFKDRVDKYLVADCTDLKLSSIPEIKTKDVETFNLHNNHIGELTKTSLSMYPSLKRLLLSWNRVYAVEPEALAVLDSLEMLDLTTNSMKEVPPGLPKSLRWLSLSENPVEHFENLPRATGLRTLVLRKCKELRSYPDLGVMPSLLELDMSLNDKMTGLDPVRLAGTCRLTSLNVTGDNELFEPGRPGAHCRCRRVVEWAAKYHLQLVGLGECPGPLPDDGDDDDPNGANCTRVPEAALVAYRECTDKWEHLNTPYWAIGCGLAVVAGLLTVLCVCLCRRRRRGKGLAAASADKGGGNGGAKENNDAKEQLNDDAAAVAAGRTDPTALLP